MTHDEWKAEGVRLFGPDVLAWRFVCPVCRVVRSVADYQAAGAPSSAAGFSCLGRWLPKDRVRESFGGNGPGPCDYAGGGLFQLNPVTVTFPDGEAIQVFAFAEGIQQATAQPPSADASDPHAPDPGNPSTRDGASS